MKAFDYTCSQVFVQRNSHEWFAAYSKEYTWCSLRWFFVLIIQFFRATAEALDMMTPSNRYIFRVTGPLWWESTGHRWTPLTKVSDAELLMFFVCAWTNGWANYRSAVYLRRHHDHYGVTVKTVMRLPNYHCGICVNGAHESTKGLSVLYGMYCLRGYGQWMVVIVCGVWFEFHSLCIMQKNTNNLKVAFLLWINFWVHVVYINYNQSENI